MNRSGPIQALALCALLGLPQGQRAAGAEDVGLRSLELSDIKVQWFSADNEDLPAWINARFDVGPLGGVSGRVVETDLAADGTDEDGDPGGFGAKVFDTGDGTLRGVALGLGGCDFTTVFPDKDSGRATYRLRRGGDPRGWLLSVAQRSGHGLYVGHNRFPLTGRMDRGGVLEIYPAPDVDNGDPTDQL